MDYIALAKQSLRQEQYGQGLFYVDMSAQQGLDHPSLRETFLHSMRLEGTIAAREQNLPLVDPLQHSLHFASYKRLLHAHKNLDALIRSTEEERVAHLVANERTVYNMYQERRIIHYFANQVIKIISWNVDEPVPDMDLDTCFLAVELYREQKDLPHAEILGEIQEKLDLMHKKKLGTL